MTIVTDLKYGLETKLVNKLDIMIARCTNQTKRKDALLIIEGAEGEGKTNSSEAVSYYVKYKTGRDIHMFFRLKPLFEFAKSTSEKIIIWDEPAIDSLSTDWYRKASKDIIRLLMVCRKKRHFLIFNFVKFYKFSEYIVVDRALGLVHMYSRYETESGRMAYIRKKHLENLFNDYKQKKQRNYKKYMAFGGTFPVVEHLIGKMGIYVEGKLCKDLQMYEELKDRAIESIGIEDEEVHKAKIEIRELKNKIGLLALPIKNKVELCKGLGVAMRTLRDWALLGKKAKEKADNAREAAGGGLILNSGIEKEIIPTLIEEQDENNEEIEE